MFSYQLTEDACMKLLEPRHAEELYALIDRNRPHLREWLNWVDGTQSAADSKSYIQYMLKRYSEGNGLQAGIWFQGSLAGVISFHSIDEAHKATVIGYWLGAEFQGRGLMTKACAAMTRHALTDLGLNRVEIRVATGNEKSRAIPERLGFRAEGVLREAERIRDRYVDHAVYSFIKKDTSAQTP